MKGIGNSVFKVYLPIFLMNGETRSGNLPQSQIVSIWPEYEQGAGIVNVYLDDLVIVCRI